jgi:hypothetical protein
MCFTPPAPGPTPAHADDYQRDGERLRTQTPVVELVRGNLRVAVTPPNQGCVMTSTGSGL